MSRKNMILLIAGGAVALVLVCILVVGLVDGIWPWDGITAYSRLLDPPTEPTTEPTEPEDPTDESEPVAESVDQNNDISTEQTQAAGNLLPNEENIQVGVDINGVTTPTGGAGDSTEGSGEGSSSGEGDSSGESGSSGGGGSSGTDPVDDWTGGASDIKIPGWNS